MALEFLSKWCCFPVRRFKTSYVKFEAVNRHYRSIWQELEVFPEIIWNTPAGHCPFEAYRGRRRLRHDVERAEVEERDPRPQEGGSEHRNSQELSNTPNQSRWGREAKKLFAISLDYFSQCHRTSLMAQCPLAASYQISPCWLRSMSPSQHNKYGVTRPQWVNVVTLQ